MNSLGDAIFSYWILFLKVTQLAAGLHGLQLNKGDRVGIWGLNHMKWLLAFYAVARAGFILVVLIKYLLLSNNLYNTFFLNINDIFHSDAFFIIGQCQFSLQRKWTEVRLE